MSAVGLRKHFTGSASLEEYRKCRKLEEVKVDPCAQLCQLKNILLGLNI